MYAVVYPCFLKKILGRFIQLTCFERECLAKLIKKCLVLVVFASLYLLSFLRLLCRITFTGRLATLKRQLRQELDI